MSILKDFRDFAMKGNVIDLATAVIIGSAFGKIVSSLVSDILMPVIGILIGKISFKDLKITVLEAAEGQAEVAIPYGIFIQNVFDFLIIAMCIFFIVKLYQRTQKKVEAAPPPAPPQPTNEEKLLTEIRDLLKAQK